MVCVFLFLPEGRKLNLLQYCLIFQREATTLFLQYVVISFNAYLEILIEIGFCNNVAVWRLKMNLSISSFHSFSFLSLNWIFVVHSVYAEYLKKILFIHVSAFAYTRKTQIFYFNGVHLQRCTNIAIRTLK